MNKLCKLLELNSNDELFEKITGSFKEKILQWDYFVNWTKVLTNVKPIERELNLLNVLVGKQENFDAEALALLKEYPQVIKTFPRLIAIREQSIDILIDTKNFIYRNFSFSDTQLTDEKCIELVEFIKKTGLASLLKDKTIKNLVDYTLGVEVGLDTNGRKNRGGTLMENLVEDFVKEVCSDETQDILYMPQATAKKIKDQWGLNVNVDKSSRKLDFAINKGGQLYFIECNFYGGGGSKLKSTATEYIQMNRYWNEQEIKFIWITDGFGWQSTLKPLREYFDRSDYLLNLEMLRNGTLKNIIKHD